MSMKKLAVLSALHNYEELNASHPMKPTSGPPPTPVHGVNVMLGGAMISGIILVVFIMCYCCHKTQRKAQHTNLPSYWRDPGGLNMEIYTVEAQSCFNVSDDFSIRDRDDGRSPQTPGPPPPYDVVVPIHKVITHSSDEEESTRRGGAKGLRRNSNRIIDVGTDESGLPSYDAAVKQLHHQASGNGYV